MLVGAAGGKDKGLPLDGLVDAARRCTRVIAHGAGGERLARACAARGVAADWHADTRSAMMDALARTPAGHVLLYSPSFSSYDEFRNFRDRAELFRALCVSGMDAAADAVTDTES